MSEGLKPGQVYINKRNRTITYALIIHEVRDDGSFSYRDTSSLNTRMQFSPVTTLGETQEQLLEGYELATPERLEWLISSLEEEAGVVAEKLRFLKEYCE